MPSMPARAPDHGDGPPSFELSDHVIGKIGVHAPSRDDPCGPGMHLHVTPVLLEPDGHLDFGVLGVFLDIAPGGFAPRPMKPAVLLYPPATGTLQWAGFLDESEGWPDASLPPLWRVTVTASAAGLDIVSRWDGAAPEPAAGLRIVMPLAETRKVRLNGVDAAPVRQTVMGVERLLF